MYIDFSGLTDVGIVRQNNEDRFCNLLIDLVAKEVSVEDSNALELTNMHKAAAFIVADGMGGMAAGEIAAEVAVETAKRFFKEKEIPIENDGFIVDYLKEILLEGHEAIKIYASNNPKSFGMGTTLTIGLVHGDKLFIVWSGDSRCYRYAPYGVQQLKSYDLKELEIITPDHSEVWEMVEKGELTSEEARVHERSNVITQSLGDPTVPPQPDFRIIDLYEGDKILFCSDGLNGMMDDFYISQIMGSDLPSEDLVLTLKNAATSGGGADNITVTVVEVKKGNKPTINNANSFASTIVTQKVNFEKESINAIPNENQNNEVSQLDLLPESKSSDKHSIVPALVSLVFVIGMGCLLYGGLTKTDTTMASVIDEEEPSKEESNEVIVNNREKKEIDKTSTKPKNNGTKKKKKFEGSKIVLPNIINENKKVESLDSSIQKERPIQQEYKKKDTSHLDSIIGKQEIPITPSLDSLRNSVLKRISDLKSMKEQIVNIESSLGTKINNQEKISKHKQALEYLNNMEKVLGNFINQIDNYGQDTKDSKQVYSKLLTPIDQEIKDIKEKFDLK